MNLPAYSGHTQLDELIARFIKLDPLLEDWDGAKRRLSEMRFDPDRDRPGAQPSTGFCAAAHGAFISFAYQHFGQTPRYSAFSASGPCAIADHGYIDAPYFQTIEHMDDFFGSQVLSDEHIATIFTDEHGRKLMIDFSASQYGYQQWPRIQQQVPGVGELPSWYDRINLHERAREFQPPKWQQIDWELGLPTPVLPERSGHEKLDALIEEFASAEHWPRYWEVYDDYTQSPTADLRDPDKAKGQCGYVAHAFIKMCKQQGLDARMSVDVRKDGQAWDNPDALGYTDRTLAGRESHITAIIAIDQELFSVDFTAAQYGYDAFPLVQRHNRWLGWQRSWTPTPKLSDMTPIGRQDRTQPSWEQRYGLDH